MFENLKQKMLDRIEKDSIKIDVNGDKVYLKTSGIPKEWHVIYPPINPETKEWDMTNLIFGGKANAVKTFVVVVITLLLAFGVWNVVHSYNVVMSNPLIQQCIESAGIVLG